MNFSQIQERLLARVRDGVQNGEWTERGFARTVGISQPHVNKVLKGTRSLSPENIDLILSTLHCSVLDLCTELEVHSHLTRRSGRPEPTTEMRLTNFAGPNLTWITRIDEAETHSVPCSVITKGRSLKLVRLGLDPEMDYSAQGYTIGVVDISSDLCVISPHEIYAIDREKDTVLRHLRRGARSLYMNSDLDENNPIGWEIVHGTPPIRGKLVWLGREG